MAYHSKDSGSNEIEYSLCDASEDASFDNLLKMQSSRYWIKRSFQSRIHGEKLEFMAL
jgi:hypothetical protein